MADIVTGGGISAETDPIVGAITGLVKADGGGNISAAVADTDYSTPAGVATLIDSSRSEIAYFADVKATTTEGGTFTQGAWRTRDVNTIDYDPNDLIDISSNQITIKTAGTYEIYADAPAYRVGKHKLGIYDITGTAFVGYGTCSLSDDTDGAQNQEGHSRSSVRAVVTIASANVYEIQHYCTTTSASLGFGRATADGSNERYTNGYVRRIA